MFIVLCCDPFRFLYFIHNYIYVTQVQLQNMMSSKFIGYFLEQVSDWQKKLATADSVISIWFEVQLTWSHLESIFIGSEDIRAQLPEHSKTFDTIDTDFKVLFDVCNNIYYVHNICHITITRAAVTFSHLAIHPTLVRHPYFHMVLVLAIGALAVFERITFFGHVRLSLLPHLCVVHAPCLEPSSHSNLTTHNFHSHLCKTKIYFKTDTHFWNHSTTAPRSNDHEALEDLNEALKIYIKECSLEMYLCTNPALFASSFLLLLFATKLLHKYKTDSRSK